jgi:RNA polymerase sigma-70 factor (ECF subfamily)
MTDGGSLDVEALYRRYGPMVIRRCRFLLRDESEAEDVAQEVFVRLIRGRERMTNTYPSSLLYRIATNLSLNRLRDRRRHEDLPGDDLLNRIARLDNLDAPVLLDRLFGRQPESTRTMAVLHHVDGLTLEQVARECGMSVSGVRRRLRVLRDALIQMGGPITATGGRA